MKNKVITYILISLLLLNHNLFAAGILGKVLLYDQEKEPPKINPVFEGDTINYPGKYIITLSGATIVAKPGTMINTLQESDVTVINLVSGNAIFRIDPSRISVSFRTPYGEVYTPAIYPANNGIVDGEIYVKDSTILELNEGVMESRTLNGVRTIESGQAVLLTQAEIEKSENMNNNNEFKNTDSDLETQKTAEPKNVANVNAPLPDKLIELLSLIGEDGTATSPLTPVGDVKIATVKEWDGKAEIVGYDLSSIDNAYLPQDSLVKVICVKVDGQDNSQLLVRPVDKLYPEQGGEINLVNLDAESQSDMQPEGFIKLKGDQNDEKLKNRSIENWNAVVVGNDMKPKGSAYILEDTDLKIVCLRSVLLVKPTYLVNKEHLKMIGKTAVLVKEFSSPGKVNVEGKIYNAIPVDYNMQMKPNIKVPVGTELTVVGVRGTDSTLLVQNPSEVLEELKFVGGEAEALDKMKPYGEVILTDQDGRKWSSVLVTNDLIPFYGVEVEKGTKLTIVGVFTQLLVTESEILIGWYDPSSFVPILTTLGIVVGGPGTIIGGGIIIDDNLGGGGNNMMGDDDDEASPIF